MFAIIVTLLSCLQCVLSLSPFVAVQLGFSSLANKLTDHSLYLPVTRSMTDSQWVEGWLASHYLQSVSNRKMYRKNKARPSKFDVAINGWLMKEYIQQVCYSRQMFKFHFNFWLFVGPLCTCLALDPNPMTRVDSARYCTVGETQTSRTNFAFPPAE